MKKLLTAVLAVSFLIFAAVALGTMTAPLYAEAEGVCDPVETDDPTVLVGTLDGEDVTYDFKFEYTYEIRFVLKGVESFTFNGETYVVDGTEMFYFEDLRGLQTLTLHATGEPLEYEIWIYNV